MSSPRLDDDVERDPGRFLNDFENQYPGITSLDKFKVDYKKFMRYDPHGMNCVDQLSSENFTELFEKYSARAGKLPKLPKKRKKVGVVFLKDKPKADPYPKGSPTKRIRVGKGRRAYSRSYNKWPEERANYLKNFLNVRDNKLLTGKINTRFNSQYSISAVQTKKSRLRRLLNA